MENQQELWNKIAPEWYKFKEIPAEHTLKFLKQQQGKVLDLGSGSGRHLSKIKNKRMSSLVNSSKSQIKGKMYLLDFSEEMIELAKKKSKKLKIPAEFIVADMTNLPFDDEFFDAAIAISSIHCIEGQKNRKNAVKELYRVLKPGALAEIGVWNKKSKRFKNADKEKYVAWTDKGKRYYYLYEESEIHNLFKKIGFSILSTHNSEMMINFIAQKP